MNHHWLWILVGGVFETGWATGMKMSESFTNIPWTIITLILIVCSVHFLNKGLKVNKGLKAGLPMGPCYAVWVGIGAVGSIIVGLVVFNEMLNILGWAFLVVIIIGILGLNLVTEGESPEPGDDERE